MITNIVIATGRRVKGLGNESCRLDRSKAIAHRHDMSMPCNFTLTKAPPFYEIYEPIKDRYVNFTMPNYQLSKKRTQC